ncbi:MAG: hypothetical protein AB8F34_13640 [Akkermansiaceae bacterium]
MKSNKRNHRITVAILALGVGAGVLFFGHHLPWVQGLDHAAVKSAEDSINVIHEYDQESDRITISTLIENPKDDISHQLIAITDDSERIFETIPPSALDYAVILESLHNRGYRHVNITTRLNWENDPGLLAAGLDLRLALFDSAVVPLAVTRGPKEGVMPKMLEKSLISFAKTHGDSKLIPVVNRTVLTPQITGSARGTLAGFYSIESNPPAEGRIAMIARWENRGMIPSYELLTIMQTHGIKPDQIVIHCGEHIRLGKNGPVIPIDSYGQTTRTAAIDLENRTTLTQADTIITRKKSEVTNPYIATIHATGKHTIPTNAIQRDELNMIIAMTNSYLIASQKIKLQRLPRWADFVILFDLTFIVFFLRGTSRSNQHLGFALTAVLFFPLLYSLISISDHWMVVSAPLAMVFTGWLVPFSSRRSTSSMQDYSTNDPKPVIRA